MRAIRTRTARNASRTLSRKTIAATASSGTTRNVSDASRASTRKSTTAKPTILKTSVTSATMPGREHLGDVLDVVGRARDQAPDRIAVEEAEMQPLDVGEDGGPQVAHRGLAGARHHERAPVRDGRARDHHRQIDAREPGERRPARRRLEPAAEARAPVRADQVIEPGLHDPGGRQLEQEAGHDQRQREQHLAAVGRDEVPQARHQAGVVGPPSASSSCIASAAAERAAGSRALTPAPPHAPALRRDPPRAPAPGPCARTARPARPARRGCRAPRCAPPRARRSDPPCARCSRDARPPPRCAPRRPPPARAGSPLRSRRRRWRACRRGSGSRGRSSSARASAVRWRWPPESITPRSPTTVSQPSGRSGTSFASCARRAASTIISRARVGAAEGDVLRERHREEERVLGNHRDARRAACAAGSD